MAHLITGYAGTGHITAADAAIFNAGICGPGKYVMDTAEKFACNIISNNQIEISSGNLINQGRHINIPINTTETVILENGNQGSSRIDLIVMRYSKDTATGIEQAKLTVIKGSDVATGTKPTVPEYISGDIADGDVTDDFPLYEVRFDGLVISKVEAVFEILPSFQTIASAILEKAYPVGSIYMSMNNTSPGVLFGGTWKRISERFLVGATDNHVTVAPGSTGGNGTVTLIKDNLPAHTHTVPAHTHTATETSAGAHTHNIYIREDNSKGGTAERIGAVSSHKKVRATSSAGAHTHKITVSTATATNTGSIGAAKPVKIIPPFIAVNMWQRIS